MTDIYNHYVVNTAITFDLQTFTVATRRRWFDDHAENGSHRLLVATGSEGECLGYASSSRWRPKPAYNTTVEASLYLRPDAVGRLVSKARRPTRRCSLRSSARGRLHDHGWRQPPKPSVAVLFTRSSDFALWACSTRSAGSSTDSGTSLRSSRPFGSTASTRRPLVEGQRSQQILKPCCVLYWSAGVGRLCYPNPRFAEGAEFAVSDRGTLEVTTICFAVPRIFKRPWL